MNPLPVPQKMFVLREESGKAIVKICIDASRKLRKMRRAVKMMVVDE